MKTSLFKSLTDYWRDGSGVLFPTLLWAPGAWPGDLWPYTPSPLESIVSADLVFPGRVENSVLSAPYALIETIDEQRVSKSSRGVVDQELIRVSATLEKRADANDLREIARSFFEDCDTRIEWPPGVKVIGFDRENGGPNKKLGAWNLSDTYTVTTQRRRP